MSLIEKSDGGFILDESDCQPPYKPILESESEEGKNHRKTADNERCYVSCFGGIK